MFRWSSCERVGIDGSNRSGVRFVLILLFAIGAIITIARIPKSERQFRQTPSIFKTPTVQSKKTGTTQSQIKTTDANDERARVGKVSILYGDPKPVYERALRTHKAHNRIHGYPFFIQRESILDGYWTKPAHLQAVILRELEKPRPKRLEWIYWVDADTVVLNYQTPLEAFLPPEGDAELSDIQIIVTEDWNGLNNGVFAIRVDKYAVELFAGVLAFRDFRENTTLEFQDQSAMEKVLQQQKFAAHRVEVPQRWFNSYKSNKGEEPEGAQVHPGDFLVHFAGVENREEEMTKWCELSERTEPLWNSRLSDTKFDIEIRKFWEEVKRNRKKAGQGGRDARRRLQDMLGAVEKSIQGQTDQLENEEWRALSASFEHGKKVLEAEAGLNDDVLTEDDIRALKSVADEIQNAYESVTEI
ncbi:hypothetical protein QQS21_001263 [Conoideocrella luteorostrata]|uniref:Galactosyl transferase GMA12/MNN10 family protein n=1 Tax=Conoideocrella luteorostrata TaxID=1105319 RepID=A0AAJ0CX81_9HYPO|nr:hypothetical protein QQS21_001263 [Conoideocrella luteorostrata]